MQNCRSYFEIVNEVQCSNGAYLNGNCWHNTQKHTPIRIKWRVACPKTSPPPPFSLLCLNWVYICYTIEAYSGMFVELWGVLVLVLAAKLNGTETLARDLDDNLVVIVDIALNLLSSENPLLVLMVSTKRARISSRDVACLAEEVCACRR